MMISILVLFLGLFAAANAHGIINSPASGTMPWYNPALPNKIPLCKIPYNYNVGGAFGGSLQDLATLEAGMRAVEKDLGNSIKFTRISQIPGYVGPYINMKQRRTATAEVSCSGINGYYPYAGENSGQDMVVFGGGAPGGCLDDPRDTMRVLVNALGLRNEWLSAKRNGKMIIAPEANSRVSSTLTSLNMFASTYDPNLVQDVMSDQDFDTQSVTMIKPTRFAQDPARPPFTMAAGLKPIGTQPRLSQSDCITLRYLYGHCPTVPVDFLCEDPYLAVSAMGYDVEGADEPTVIRALQCPLVSSVLPLATGIPLAQLVIKNLPYTVGQPAPVLALVPAIPGIKVEAVAVLNPVILIASNAPAPAVGGDLAPCTVAAGAACAWSAKFTWTLPKNQGMTSVINLQVKTTTAAGVVTTTILPLLTLNINCAPQFKSISANVGYSASSVSSVIRETGVLPNGIVYQSGTKLNVPAQVYAADNIILSKYMINYFMPIAFGTGGPPLQVAGTATPKKVFVNCNQAAIALPVRIAGANAVATVAATDPEGGVISYFAYSGIPNTAPATGAGDADTASAEQHTVTKDGVVLVSPYAAVTGAVDPYDGSAGGNGGNVAGGPLDKTSLANDKPKDIFIVAVDPQGAYSVLHSRFFFACGVAQA